MKVKHLNEMTRGWFVGNFDPTLYKTNDCEVAIKRYSAGDYENKHYHRIATEITVIVKGRVKMFDMEFTEGDMVVAEPGDATDFTAILDTISVVVKIPCVSDDKYLI